jgi:hypothetical protein
MPRAIRTLIWPLLLLGALSAAPPAGAATATAARGRRCAAREVAVTRRGPCLRIAVPRTGDGATARERAIAPGAERFAAAGSPATRRLLRSTAARRRALAPWFSARAGAAAAGRPRARAASGVLALPPAPVFGAWQQAPAGDAADLNVDDLRVRQTDGELPAGQDGEHSGVELVGRRGGTTIGRTLVQTDTLTSCPDPDGVVHGTWEFTVGQAAGQNGRFVEWLATARASYEATVGDDARLQTWRYRAEAELETRGYATDARGRRRHEPTRRLRAVFSRANLDPRRGSDERLLRDLTAQPPRLMGPKGGVTAAQAEALAGRVGQTIAMLENDARTHLLKAETGWYDDFRCVEVAIDGPGKLRKGASATYTSQPHAHDGRPVTGPVALSAAGVSVSPTSGSVAPGAPFQTTARMDGDGGSFDLLVTSRRGRGKGFEAIALERAEARRFRFTIAVGYGEEMGPTVAPTTFEGTGTVEATVGGGFVEGTGSYSGSEWDASITNICGGPDMLRARGFSGSALVGAEADAKDGTVTVTFAVPSRPFDMSWIETFPLAGGTRAWESTQPFCTDPQGAKTRTSVTVRSTPLE